MAWPCLNGRFFKDFGDPQGIYEIGSSAPVAKSFEGFRLAVRTLQLRHSNGPNSKPSHFPGRSNAMNAWVTRVF